jgi:hypothetical protein
LFLFVVAYCVLLIVFPPEPNDQWEPIIMHPESTVIGAIGGLLAAIGALRLGRRAWRQFRELRIANRR